MTDVEIIQFIEVPPVPLGVQIQDYLDLNNIQANDIVDIKYNCLWVLGVGIGCALLTYKK